MKLKAKKKSERNVNKIFFLKYKKYLIANKAKSYI